MGAVTCCYILKWKSVQLFICDLHGQAQLLQKTTPCKASLIGIHAIVEAKASLLGCVVNLRKVIVMIEGACESSRPLCWLHLLTWKVLNMFLFFSPPLSDYPPGLLWTLPISAILVCNGLGMFWRWQSSESIQQLDLMSLSCSSHQINVNCTYRSLSNNPDGWVYQHVGKPRVLRNSLKVRVKLSSGNRPLIWLVFLKQNNPLGW